MGWFDNQIKERLRCDEERFDAAMWELNAAVTGRDAGRGEEYARQARDAVADVLGYYGAKPRELPRGCTELQDVLDFQLRPLGIMYRRVKLTPGWSSDAAGAMLAEREDGSPVALLPHGAMGYAYKDHSTGKTVPIRREEAVGLREGALCFYRPLPLRAISLRDVLAFIVRSLDVGDWVLVVMAALAVSLLGMALPAVNELVFGPVIESGSVGLVLPIAVLLLSIYAAQIVLGSIRSALTNRIHTKVSVGIDAAMMMRVLSLPAPFFKEYAAGNLSSRISVMGAIVGVIENVVLGTALTSLFSLVYIAQIATIAPSLALPAFAAIAASVAVSAAVSFSRSKVNREMLEISAKRSGWEYALIGGIQKIRLAGAERRAFSTWAQLYAREARLTYNGPVLVRFGGALQTAVSLAGTLAIYWVALSTGVDVAQYMAFTVAYGMVSGAFSQLGSLATQGMALDPYLEMVEPIFKAVPEVSEGKRAVERISGGFEFDRVTFAYGEDLPPVLRDLTLKVRPGQYVGIVGRTGCGKSTLMRLLLGFEVPQQGAVYFDGKDLQTLDVRSVRRNIGVVLQDGKLFQGDIFSNIVVSASWLTLDDAWRAAELAGIANDIRAMPMGMHTMVSEGSGGISGGQKQRIMIARAIVANPKILLFDEATSALDNVTQRVVSESLESLKCTRVAIAHRLSTIRHCDRILVLDKGAIVEDGTYEELIERRGVFYELVERQRV